MVPSAALIKAVLINGAVEITGAGAYDNNEPRYPNNQMGWGRILINNTLYFSGGPRGLKVFNENIGISTGQFKTYSVPVYDSSQSLKVTLVWTDYPATTGAQRTIVNDLDLLVTDPLGNQYKGNVFGGTNPHQSTTDGNYDGVNVEEGVLRLPSFVVPGSWTIRVTGKNVPNGPQPFVVVVSYGRQYKGSLTAGILPSSQTVYYNPAGCLAPTAGFNGTSSGGSGTYNYAWGFGDGGTGTGIWVQHTYPGAPVTYAVALIVTDSNGKWGNATASVTVKKVSYC